MRTCHRAVLIAMLLILGALLWPKGDWALAQVGQPQSEEPRPHNVPQMDAPQIDAPSTFEKERPAASVADHTVQAVVAGEHPPVGTSEPSEEPAEERLTSSTGPSSIQLNRSGNFFAGIFRTDPLCEDVSRGSYFRCINQIGAVCARSASCPPIAIDRPPPSSDISPRQPPKSSSSLLELRAQRCAAAASHTPDAVVHVEAGQEQDPYDGHAMMVKHKFCRFRDAFIAWNATAHMMTTMCNEQISPLWQADTAGASSLGVACRTWTSFLQKELDKVRNRSATDGELSQAGGSSLQQSFAPEDVTALAHSLAHLPSASASVDADREALLTALLRTTRGHGHRSLMGELDLADLARRAETLLRDEASALKERQKQRRISGAGPVPVESHLGEAATAVLEAPTWGCQGQEYPVVRIAVIGEPIQGGWFDRVQRLLDTMCTYCRGTRYVAKLQAFLHPSASIATNEGSCEPFQFTAKYSSSLEWSPDIVVVALGLMDAKLGGSTFNRAQIAKEIERMTRVYLELPSKPEVIVVVPHQIFDVETDGHRRKPRVLSMRDGPAARRLRRDVVPGIVEGAQRAAQHIKAEEGGASRVRLLDFYKMHLRWLRRAIHEGSPSARDETGPSETEEEVPLPPGGDPLEAIPFDMPHAQHTLKRLQPDGTVLDKNSQKLQRMAVFQALVQRE